MDTYFPEDEGEETGIGGAQVDEQGAFAFQTDLQAPQGGFSFVSLPHSLLTPSDLLLNKSSSIAGQHVVKNSVFSPLASHTLFSAFKPILYFPLFLLIPHQHSSSLDSANPIRSSAQPFDHFSFHFPLFSLHPSFVLLAYQALSLPSKGNTSLSLPPPPSLFQNWLKAIKYFLLLCIPHPEQPPHIIDTPFPNSPPHASTPSTLAVYLQNSEVYKLTSHAPFPNPSFQFSTSVYFLFCFWLVLLLTRTIEYNNALTRYCLAN